MWGTARHQAATYTIKRNTQIKCRQTSMPGWDSNPRSHSFNEQREFIPQATRSLSSALECQQQIPLYIFGDISNICSCSSQNSFTYTPVDEDPGVKPGGSTKLTFPPSMNRLATQRGSLDISQAYGPARSVTGLALSLPTDMISNLHGCGAAA
jgi:hypothetical protein